MFKKFLSRKLLMVILTGIVDLLVLTGQADPGIKDLVVKLITGLGTLYVTVEGIRDIVIAIRSKITP